MYEDVDRREWDFDFKLFKLPHVDSLEESG